MKRAITIIVPASYEERTANSGHGPHMARLCGGIDWYRELTYRVRKLEY